MMEPGWLRSGSLVSVLIYALIAILTWNRVRAIDVVPDVITQADTWIVSRTSCSRSS